jgi:hypothetical protein
MRIGYQVAHALTGEVGTVESVGTGKFENYVRIRWNLTDELHHHKPDFVTDASRALEIKKAHRKRKPLPDESDD